YMAPELVRGERSITGNVDLYALGCLLYEIVAGKPPFTGDNFAQIFNQHLNAPIPSLRENGVDCPAEFDRLVQHLLAKNPDDRPFNARDVQGRLGEMISAKPVKGSTLDKSAGEVNGRALLRRRLTTLGNPMYVSWPTLVAIAIVMLLTISGLAYFAR
ncbi:MAG: protein kinase, partial [Planctomycetales bacterium]|nr:protein kinase [Planctomycetales bacterium]